MKGLNKFANNVLNKKADIKVCVLSFSAILVVRCFIEQFVAVTSPLTPGETAVEALHNLFFFSITFLLLWIFASFALEINPSRLAYLLNWAFFLMLFPPLIDMARAQGEIYWSFYLLGDIKTLWVYFSSIFGHLPPGIVYFGTKLTFLAAIVILSPLVYIRSKSILRTVFTAIGSYALLFFMGVFPSFLTHAAYLFSGKSLSGVKDLAIVQFVASSPKVFGVEFASLKYLFSWRLDFVYFPFLVFLLTALFYLIDKKRFISVLKNARYPQLVYHGGLFFIGMGLGILRFPENFNPDVFSMAAAVTLLVSVFLAWEASVVLNDIYDFEIDKITNPNRPLVKKIFEKEEYAQLGVLFFLLSLIGGLTVGFWFFILLLVYQILAWAYSAPPFRLKKFPGVATFTSSLALITILFLGYILLSDGHNIHSLSWRIILLLLITYTISLPIKDFKDIEGDAKYGVWTIPVIFGEKRGRLIVAVNLFISYVLSVFFLNEPRLFLWALVFGALTFWVVTFPKTKPRQLFWPVLGLVFIYGVILVKIVFL